jgi:hypothetical protein
MKELRLVSSGRACREDEGSSHGHARLKEVSNLGERGEVSDVSCAKRVGDKHPFVCTHRIRSSHVCRSEPSLEGREKAGQRLDTSQMALVMG